MGFKFRLQKLLDYKETIEGLKKTEYGQRVHELSLEEGKLIEFNSKKEDLIDSLANEEKSMNIGDLRIYNNFMEKLSKDIEKQEENVDLSRKKMEEAQSQLLMAMQEKKAFEKLKEKDFDEFIEEEKKKEEKIIDEIVTFKTNAQKLGG